MNTEAKGICLLRKIGLLALLLISAQCIHAGNILTDDDADSLWETLNSIYKDEPHRAKGYAVELQTYSETANNLKLNADATRILAIIYRNDGDLISSLQEFQKALSAYKKISEAKGIATCYYNIGIIFKKGLDFKNALSYFKAALRHNTLGNRKKGIVLSYYQMGYCNVKLNTFDKGEKDLQTALSLSRIDNPAVEIDILNTIGMLHFDKGDYRKAIVKYSEVNAIAVKDSIAEMEGIALNNMAEAHYKLMELSKADLLADQALKLRVRDNNLEWILSTLILKTRIAMSMGNAEVEIGALKEGTAKIDKGKISKPLLDGLDLLSQIVNDSRYEELFSRGELVELANILNSQSKLLYDLNLAIEEVRNKYAFQTVVEGFELTEKNNSLKEGKRDLLIMMSVFVGLVGLALVIVIALSKKRTRETESKFKAVTHKLNSQFKEVLAAYDFVVKEHSELKERTGDKDVLLNKANKQMLILLNKLDKYHDIHREYIELHTTLLLVAREKGKIPPLPPNDKFGDRLN